MPLFIGLPRSSKNLGQYWAHTRGMQKVCWCSSCRSRFIRIIKEQHITQSLKLVPRAVSDLVSDIEENATSVMGNAELETLKLLEWRDVCKQVASFCCTPLAAQQAWNGSLLIGKTMGESELLLEQTREAGKLDVNFGKIYDIRRAVAAALDGRILHPLLLAGIVTTLRSASDIENAISNLHASGIEVPSLKEVSKGIRGGLGELQAAITECISVSSVPMT
jgi:hypothetical protein